MLFQVFSFLIEALFGFFVFVLLLRFYMQWLRVPFRNPVGIFVTSLSNWIVLPARRVIPGLFGVDLATLLLAWLTEIAMWLLIYELRSLLFSAPLGGQLSLLGVVALLGMVEVVKLSLYLLIGVVMMQVVISWVNPYAPLAPIFDAMTRPFYRIFRRVIPPIGNVDLSPLFVLLLAQVLLIPLATLARMFVSPF